MIHLARASIRRPKATLAFWAVFAIVLALIGLGVDRQLAPTQTVVPGTESSRAQHLATAKFGPSQLVPILLEGPKAQLDQQGPQLVRVLLKRPHTRALTAWDAGSASAGLRPKPTAAMIVLSVDRPMKTVVNTDQPQIDRTVARVVHKPVRSYVTGQPSIDRALKNSAVSTTQRAELIALPILFLLLLLGLRSLLAAATLTVVGAAIVLSTWGELAIIGKITDVDPIGFAGASMVALALGVGLSLLILDRFRQEETAKPGEHPREPALAATAAVATAGRAVLFAGTGLLVALLIADALGPTKILTSIGTGTVVCALLSMGAAVVVLPAALTLFGTRITTPDFGVPAFLERGWNRLVGGGRFVTRHAVIAGAVATAAIAALAVPALSLKTGPPDPKQLPPDSGARIAFAEVSRVMGPGWPTPYNIIVASKNQPITSSAMLARIDAFERQIARDNQVYSVVGPGSIRAQTAQLGKFPGQLQSSAKLLKGGPQQLGLLASGLGQAGAGASQLQSGLKQASSGAGQLQGGAGLLHNGSQQAQSGSAQLHAGLATARSGSAQISDGLNQALAGATQLKNGAASALSGSGQVTSGLAQASSQVTGNLPALGTLVSAANQTSSAAAGLQTSAKAAANETQAAIGALQSLPASAKNDPAYAAALQALQSANSSAQTTASNVGGVAAGASLVNAGVGEVKTQVSALSQGLVVLHNGAASLQGGIALLRDGNSQLANGIAQLSNGGGQLTNGLGQLTDGAGALQNGLGQLTNGIGALQSGAGQLASGLAAGVGPTGELVTGLGVMQAGVEKFKGQLPSPRDLELLQQQSPGLFYNGYFILAAVQGAPPAARNQASFAINLSQGGTAGQIVVVPRYPASDKRTEALGQRLQTMTDRFVKASGAQAAVGGPAGELADYKSATNDKLPWVVLGLAIGIALVLMISLRAVLLPIVAVAFNLLTAAAAFGALELLFGGSNPPAGGPGWLDPMSIIAIFTAVFGISLVWQVLLLTRTREAYLAHGDPHRGLDEGLRKTAAAATGAGLVVVAAILPFVFTELAPVKQFGIGIAVAVLLDTLIVRPVLLPAAVEVLGRRAWWPTSAGARPKPRVHRRRIPRPHARRPHALGSR